MSVSTSTTVRANVNERVGIVRPDDLRGQRAERAIGERRLSDAARNIRSMPEGSLVDRFWKTLLRSADKLIRDGLPEAEALAWQAIGLASTLQLMGDEQNCGHAQRLIARALNHVGIIKRRQELLREAAALHEVALRLRTEYGSIEERWESLAACAIDAEMGGDIAGALTHVREAVSVASRASEEPLVKQASCWDHLVRVLQKSDQHDQAVEAARSARRLWREHDTGSATAAQADARLGGTLLTCEVARRGADGSVHVDAMNEAEQLLSTAAESLAAFGSAYDTDARWAKEQLDFVRRLRKDAEQGA